MMTGPSSSSSSSSPSSSSLLPHFTLCSHNLCRLSAYADTPSGLARQHNLAANIRKQATQFDVLLFQDTGLRQNDLGAFKAVGGLHLWKHLMCNDERYVRCVSTLFSPRIQSLYSITSRSSFGVIISYLFPKNDGHRPWQVVNVYLDPNSRVIRQQQLQFILDNNKVGIFTYLMGDFNFVESLEDGSMKGHQALSSPESRVWTAILDKFSLTEIRQPTHTWFRFENSGKVVSSRIDRAFISCREADLTIASPISFIPQLPHTPLRKAQVRQSASSHLAKFSASSDHYPVGIKFVSTEPSRKRKTTIPVWLARSDAFHREFTSRWKFLGSSFQAAEAFKAHARRIAKAVLREAHTASTGTQISNLSAAIALLRLINSGDVDSDRVTSLLGRHQALSRCIDPSSHLPSYPLTATFIEEIITTPPQGPDLSPASPSLPSPTTNIIKGIKAQLPSDRKRLGGFVDYDPLDEVINSEYPVRGSFGEGVITDSDRMANMIKQYFGKIWTKRAGAPPLQEMLNYLNDYKTRISASLHPSFPNLTEEDVCSEIELSWLGVVLAAIKKSSDSCAGPDGIPFAVYRALPSICGAFLLEILIDLANGVPPPPDFNLGNLFLIPKDESGFVLNHRPITVGNSDNRLIASVMAMVLTPFCQHSLHPSQKGFIPGRTGSDHIIAITDHFYGAIDSKQPLYELKIDTKKAFDSIDHTFIEAVISTLGFEGWLVGMILLLYHHAYVTPVLTNHNHVIIPILRGVKQGCPLSPLIFAICYDPLLVYLSKINIDGLSPDLFGFADDLVAESPSLSIINTCMIMIDAFSAISGLGVNHDKSELLTALLSDARVRRAIRLLHWNRVKIVHHFKYLGILVGRKLDNHYLTVDDIFAGPLKKLEYRARVMRPILASRPLHHRTIGVNTFLLSLFSYHYQYYVPTRRICERVEQLIRPLLVPFKGTAFRLQSLYLGKGMGLFGPSTPLKELFALALTAMANQYDLSSHDGEASFLIPGFSYSLKKGWRSLSISKGIYFAAHDLVFLTHGETEGPVVSAKWIPHSPSSRKSMYNLLINQTWGKTFSNPEEVGNHIKKASRWGLGPAHFEKLTERWVSRDMLAPPFLLSHLFRMWMNSIATGERLSKMTSSALAHQPTHCHLCGTDGTPVCLDSTYHLLSGDCPVVLSARKGFFQALTLTHPLSMASSFLAHTADLPSRPRRRLLWLATLSFNWSLFQARKRLFLTLPSPPARVRAVSSLLSYVLSQWNRLVHSSKNKFIKRLAVDFGSMKLVHPIPSLTSKKKKIPTDPATLAAILGPPPGTWVYYLDGSANPNPGPAGAGAVLFRDGVALSHLSASLGHSTNNIGELYAFGIALTSIQSHLDLLDVHPPSWPAYLVTDSDLARHFITGNYHPHDKHSTLARVVSAVRRLWKLVKSRIVIKIWKVVSHTGVPGNDLADSVAGLAASRSTVADSINVHTCICSGSFTYLSHPG